MSKNHPRNGVVSYGSVWYDVFMFGRSRERKKLVDVEIIESDEKSGVVESTWDIYGRRGQKKRTEKKRARVIFTPPELAYWNTKKK